MTLLQGNAAEVPSVDRMCAIADVGSASLYRRWHERALNEKT